MQRLLNLSLLIFLSSSLLLATPLMARRAYQTERALQKEDALNPAAPARQVFNYGRDFVLSKHDPDERSLEPIANDFGLKVFLNFDGATLTVGGNDARTNKTDLLLVPSLEYPAQDWSSFGGRDKAVEDIVDQLNLLFADFAVELVTTRPESGDYTMAMIGGTGADIKQGATGTVGIAPLDCENSDKNDLALIFGNRVTSAKKLAQVIAHELGHTFGLEHVIDKTGIMYPSLNSETCCWTDAELAQASYCGRSKQDSHQILLANLGARPSPAGCSEDGGSCPEGTTCQQVGSQWACASDSGWTPHTSSSGCAVGRTEPALGAGLLPMLVAIILTLRRHWRTPRRSGARELLATRRTLPGPPAGALRNSGQRARAAEARRYRCP